MSKETLTLRALLTDVASAPGVHEHLGRFHDTLQHAPLYDVPFRWAQRAKELRLNSDEILRRAEDEFSLPKGGAILIGTPGTLYSLVDLAPGVRGLAPKRHFVELQAQTLDGDLWSGPFDVRRMAFSIAVSDVQGPGSDEAGDSFCSSIPLVIRVDVTDKLEVSVVHDPESDDVRNEKRVTGAVLTALSRAGTAFTILSHLQQSGTLEQYRLNPPPARGVH